MRRQAPTLPVSPQQLKHFAFATVVITGLLALFAGGEDAGLAAQIEATQAKNEMVAAEQQKLGTKKLKAHLNVRKDSRSQFAFADGGEVVDAQADWGGGGGGGIRRSGTQANRPTGAAHLPPPGLQGKPGVTVTRARLRKPGESGGPDSPGGPGGPESDGPPPPDFSKLEAVKSASRMRSGGAGSDGD